MASVGSLVVSLSAETSALRKGMDDARKSLGVVEKSVASLKSNLVGMVAGFVSVQAAAAAMRAVSRAVTEAEQSSGRLNAVLRATGQQSGLTADAIQEMATELSRRSLFGDEQIQNAAAALATFKGVSGQVFRETIELSADLASAFGGDLESAVQGLGRALQEPTEALTALKRAKIDLTSAQEAVILKLAKENDLLGAQRAILDAVRGRVGGVAGEMNTGLSGALHGINEGWSNLLENFGKTDGVASGVVKSLNWIAERLQAIADLDTPKIAIEVDLDAANAAVRAAKGRLGLGKVSDSNILAGVGVGTTAMNPRYAAAFSGLQDLIRDRNATQARANAMARDAVQARVAAANGAVAPVSGGKGAAEQAKAFWDKFKAELAETQRAMEYAAKHARARFSTAGAAGDVPFLDNDLARRSRLGQPDAVAPVSIKGDPADRRRRDGVVTIGDTRINTKANIPDPRPMLERVAGGIGGTFKAIGSSIAGAFGPVGLAMLALAPVMEALREPIQVVGQLLATALVPVIRALFPIIKALAIGLTYLAQIALTTSGMMLKGIGWLLVGIGKLLNLLPGSIGNPLIRLGKTLRGVGDGMLDGAEAMKKARDELRKMELGDVAENMQRLNAELRNAPGSFNYERARRRALGIGGDGGGQIEPAMPGRAGPGRTDRGGPQFNAPVTFVLSGVTNAQQFLRELGNLQMTETNRGGTNRALVAGARA